MLATLLPSLAVSARRLHDTNRSGWWLLIAAVPYGLVAVAGILALSGGGVLAFAAMLQMIGIVAVIGAVVLLVFMVLPGTPGDNRYGPAPASDGENAVPAE
jgi:uncharacterized membrane protein YhaH (DUF805 family)